MDFISCAVLELKRVFTYLFSTLFGKVSWRPPYWLEQSWSWLGKHRNQSFLAGLGLFILLAAGFSFYQYWIHAPKPVTVHWDITPPQPVPLYNLDQKMTLVLNFQASVARLDLIGKVLPRDAIELTPKLAGSWQWENGKVLVFTPTEEWPADTLYRVQLSRSFISPHKRLEVESQTFHTPPFSVEMSEEQFYINPKNPADKHITATLTFSHPVDRASLEKATRLEWVSQESIFPSQTPLITFTYAPDKRDRVVYLRSAPITSPKVAGFAFLTIPTDVRAKLGGAALADEVLRDIRVPSIDNLFNIESAQPTIVTDDQGNPGQVLVLKTSVGIQSEVLKGALHVHMLPQRKPGDEKNLYSWGSPAEVNSSVLAHAVSVRLTPIPTAEEYATIHSYKMEVPENAYIYVEVDKGIQSIGSFKLENSFSSVSAAPRYPRQVKLAHEGALLALSGERKLTVQTRGINEVEYQLSRVTPGQINNLVSQTEGTFPKPTFRYSYYFDESNLAELITRRDSIVQKDSSEANYSALDFSEFVSDTDANRGKLGLFLLHVYGRQSHTGYYRADGTVYPDESVRQARKDNPQNNPLPDDILTDQRLILLTDLGIVVKDNADSSHDVFVQSIKSGQPVGDAKVEVLGKNGIALYTVQTDDQGHAAIPSLVDFIREKQPVAYIVHRGDDLSFLPFYRDDRQLNLTRFDVGGTSGFKPEDLTAFVFTDRGIYRPGDVAKLGFIIKQHNWQGRLEGIPLRLKIYNPAGKEVQSRSVKLNATGFFDSTFATQEISPTGTYQVDCYLARGKDDDVLLGSQTLQVKEFLPDRLKMKVQLSTAAEGWVSPEQLGALVTLENLYGAAAVGHRITGKLSLEPSGFSFDKYPEYTFADPYGSDKRKEQEIQLDEVLTDDQGKAHLNFPLKQLEPAAWQLSLLSEGFEKAGGRSVKAYAHTLVSARAWLLGLKPDGEFSYLAHNSKHTVRLLAIDSHLHPLATSQTLTVHRVEERYVSALVEEPNGNYGYESVRKEIPEPDEQITVPTEGAAWALHTEQPGTFIVTFFDATSEQVGLVRYSVAGEGNLAQRLDKNAELSVKLSKPEYLAEEEIEVQITAPYTGSGLITIERDKVYAWTWFQSKTTSSVQHIRLPKGFEGNGYLHVTFVRALDSKEIYLSPLSYAVLPFRVNCEARHIVLQIDAPKVAAPGQKLEWSVTASRPTPAIVYAVDEGILQVANYTLPAPLDFFFQKQALEVGTRQTVDQILPEYSIARMVAAAGGDQGRDLLAHHLNPFKRKHDAPVVFWSGLVNLGPQVTKFSYAVPDYFASTVRLMVVAANPDAVGSAQTQTQVRGPFVIEPNLPTFVAPGDTFAVTSTVANNITGSGEQAQIAVKMETTPNLEIVQAPDANVIIPEGHDKSLSWTLRAKDDLGNADLTITAQEQGQSSHLASHLSIRPASAFLTTVTSGYFTGLEKSVGLTRVLYPQFRDGKAVISVGPQGLSKGLGAYLENYSYGCTEQLVSKAFATLVSDTALDLPLSHIEVQQHLNDAFAVAATRQSDNGAFGLWGVEPDAHFDIPSVLVVHLLLEAKENGYDVPEDMLTRGLDHLEKMAEEAPQDFYQARAQAYAIYLLTRSGQVTTNYLEHTREWFERDAKKWKHDPSFYDWREDYAGVLIASTYALLKNQGEADALITQFHFQGAKKQYDDDYYSELSRDGFALDLISLHFPERLKRINGDDLQAMARPIMDGEYSTISSAFAILGLSAYERSVNLHSTAQNQMGISEKVNDIRRSLPLSGSIIASFATYSAEAKTLIFQNASNGQLAIPGLFYEFTETGFERATVTQPMSDGIEVSRNYFHGGNLQQPTQTATLGEELTVQLSVRGVGERIITNVAVLDLLPGGFEIVPESIASGPMHNRLLEEADVREDRLNVFGAIDDQETIVTYRIKATNKGTYTVPPPQAEAMYHLKIRARGVSDTLTIN